MTAAGVVGGILIVALIAWAFTSGRRYFYGGSKRWPEIRRDLYSGSLDEGMYPLDPRPDDEVERRRDAQ